LFFISFLDFFLFNFVLHHFISFNFYIQFGTRCFDCCFLILFLIIFSISSLTILFNLIFVFNVILILLIVVCFVF
jgi:hypothetical protein